MPIFGRKDDDPPESQSPASSVATPVDDDAIPLGDVEAIGAQGRQRIAQLGGQHFNSDLGLDGFVWAHKCGFEPLDVVLGNSVYHIGLGAARWGRNMEVDVLTQAMHNGRQLALERLLAEAELRGADGVINVTLNVNRWNWGSELADICAWGTAVRYRGDPPMRKTSEGRPFTTGLKASYIWKLREAGFHPLALVYGVCVYHVAHQGIRATVRQIGRNVEMTNYTQAMYDARELSMTRMELESVHLGAAGLATSATSVNFHGWGDHVMEFFAIGNAVVPIDGAAGLPDPSLTLEFN